MKVRTRPSSGRGARKSGHRRIAGYLASDEDSSGDECFYTPRGYFDEMPDFFGDQSDLVEVTLELEEDSMVVRSVTPTSAAAAAAAALRWDSGESLSRSSSTASRIRRKFAWMMSPLPRRSLASMMAAEDEEDAAAASAAAAASGTRLSFGGSGGGGGGGGGLAPREARRIKARLERTRSGAKRALKGLRFISRTTVGAGPADAVGLWRKVEERFAKLAKDGLLSRDDFGECIGMMDSKEFAKGLFDALARRRRQSLHRINKEELHDFWLQISDQSFDARLQIFFDMVDTNEDGRITREEVQELIILSAAANKLSKLKEQAQEYAALIMEELDPENLGYIELWQLEELLLQRDRYMNYSRPMSTGSAAQWSQNIAGAGGPARPARQTFTIRRTAAKLRVAAGENWRRAWVVALWLAAMGTLFVWKFTQYRRREAFEVMGYCLTTAKGAAETLKLNMALVLLPVCRNTLTWLRSTRARLFVPFDDNITFHKMIATAIVAGILLHAGNHLLCDFPRLINASPEKYALVAGDFGENARPTYKGLVSGVEGVTGVAMVILMTISFTLATHRFRKNGARLPFPLNRLTGFNAFWYSHHLLAVVYLLLLIHGYFMFLVHKWYQRTTWMYIAIPLLIYVGERHLRAFRSKAYSVKILKVALLPGSVLTLTMSKPHGFRYRSGQYIFLQCPTISPFEWHPFSITSAPGDDYLSVHIRTNGDWTEELKHIFIENYFAPGSMVTANSNRLGSARQRSLPRLLVDGPYGAPAQDFRNYDVLLLVGLGIGATPFISILRDLLNNIKLEDELMDLVLESSRSDYSYNSHSLTSSGSSRKRSYRTSSAHFYWVTREPGSFEWFKGVMNEVAEMDKKGIIEMHNYLTSVYEERDARTTLLTMVQALNHAKTGVDIVSGTRVRTHFARPNWREVFSKLASKHPGARIGVFYCGTPTLSKELRNLSHEMSHRTSTRFHFHKEYF